MKIFNLVLSTGTAFLGLSLGLMACGGGNSNSNPGIGGTGAPLVSSVAASCANPIDASLLGAPSDVGFDRRSNYTLTSLTVYVYNPGNGDSFSASASSSRDGFQIDNRNICNGTIQGGRHSEDVSVPESLDSQGNSQDLTMTIGFGDGQLGGASVAEGNGRDDSSGLSYLGQGQVLIGADKYISSRAFQTAQGLEIRSETQFPVDRTGNRKLIFVSAQYTEQLAPQPQPGRPGRPGPGGPGEHH
jgi:hypothetical protein